MVMRMIQSPLCDDDGGDDEDKIVNDDLML